MKRSFKEEFNFPYFTKLSGELIVSKYVAESIAMIAGRFGLPIDSATYLLKINSPDINKVAKSLYDIIIFTKLLVLLSTDSTQAWGVMFSSLVYCIVHYGNSFCLDDCLPGTC